MDKVNKIKRLVTLRVNKIISSILTLPEWRVNEIYQAKIVNAFLRDAVNKRLMSFIQSTFEKLTFISILWKSLLLNFMRIG